MKKLCVILLAIIFFSAFATDSIAKDNAKNPRRKNTVLFKIKKNVTAEKLKLLQALLNSKGVKLKKKIEKLKIEMGTYSDELLTEEDVSAALVATGAVDYAEPDYLVEPVLLPDDPYFSSQWQHDKIETTGAWEVTTGSASVLVGVCDTGISSSHPDLAANLSLPGYNSVDDSSNTEPVYNHGTGVAGCIGAVGNNATGVSGVAWDVQILPIRITNRTDGAAYISDAAEGIRFAADQGARVVNLSYLMAGYSTIDSAAQYLRENSGLLFVAAGNNGVDPGWPDFSSFIAVGASTSSDTKASWSNYGSYIDIVAPGVGVYSTTGTSGYGSMSGTSFASPIAAGVAALLFSINPSFTPVEVESFIFGGCVDLGGAGEDDVFGQGRIDASNAVILAIDSEINADPVAILSADPTTGFSPLEVVFDASNSYDTEGEIVTYLWDFGDGTTGAGRVVDHTYSTEDTYTATLTVTDEMGASATGTVQIIVYAGLPVTVHVKDIVFSLIPVRGGTIAEASVLIADTEGLPVPNAVVVGDWNGPKSSTDIGTTDAYGIAELQSRKTRRSFTYVFTVIDVLLDGYDYDPSLNSETEYSISNPDTVSTSPKKGKKK